MDTRNVTLIVHHHHLVFQDSDGILWLSSVIGRWINALAPYFKEIRLLLNQSPTHSPNQDTPIAGPNVVLYSLGPRLRHRSFFQLNRNYQDAGAQVSKDADILLIRGITPQQMRVWKTIKVPKKIFLLVGQLHNRKPIGINGPEWISYFIGVLRHHEVSKMLQAGTIIMANSPVLVSEIEEFFHQSASFVPTNSIRAEEFSTLEIKPLNNPARLLYVGRLDLKKGLVELFQAAAFLNQQGQPCVLDIVGTKEEPVFSMLTILAANLNISQHLHWHGLIPFGEALFAFYRCADVLVLPSYTEGFPHVLWEAAANGCPIVTTAVGGIPAILTHEKHCLLVAPRNASELAEGIQHLLTDADLRARIIVSAHQLAEDYSVEECARKLAMALEQR